jgi:hypothetical protein
MSSPSFPSHPPSPPPLHLNFLILLFSSSSISISSFPHPEHMDVSTFKFNVCIQELAGLNTVFFVFFFHVLKGETGFKHLLEDAIRQTDWN